MHHGAVRAEIPGPVPDYPAGQKHFRIVSRTYTYPRISLGVLQQYVVLRLELLDKVVFKQEGIGFSIYDRVLGIRYLRDHDGSLAGQPLGRDEILRHPLVQVFGLAYINDIPLGVIISVDSGGMRE